jgi:hypothetical protein
MENTLGIQANKTAGSCGILATKLEMKTEPFNKHFDTKQEL